MMNKRMMAALTVAVMMTLAGCGSRAAVNVPVDDAEEKPAPVASTPVAEPSAAPSVAPTNPNYEQPITGSLAVSAVEKKKKGLVFKTLEVKGSVVNTATVPLSGEIKIEFKKKKGLINKSLETSETKTQIVALLQPGQSLPFTVTSEKSCDDAEVTVTTQAASGGHAAAANYGSPYGQAGIKSTLR